MHGTYILPHTLYIYVYMYSSRMRKTCYALDNASLYVCCILAQEKWLYYLANKSNHLPSRSTHTQPYTINVRITHIRDEHIQHIIHTYTEGALEASIERATKGPARSTSHSFSWIIALVLPYIPVSPTVECPSIHTWGLSHRFINFYSWYKPEYIVTLPHNLLYK